MRPSRSPRTGLCLLSGIHVQLRCGRLGRNEGPCSWSEVILRDASGGRYRTMRILDERLTFRLSFSICTIRLATTKYPTVDVAICAGRRRPSRHQTNIELRERRVLGAIGNYLPVPSWERRKRAFDAGHPRTGRQTLWLVEFLQIRQRRLGNSRRVAPALHRQRRDPIERFCRWSSPVRFGMQCIRTSSPWCPW